MTLNVLDIDNMSGVIRRRAGKAGAKVVYGDYDTAFTDGTSIHIPNPRVPITTQQMDLLYWFVIHECGHIKRPDAFSILKAAQPNEALQGIYNIVEDEGMEREVALANYGDSIALSKGCTTSTSYLYKRFESEEIGKEPTENEIKRVACLNLYLTARAEGWDTSGAYFYQRLRDVQPDEANELTDILLGEGWSDRMLNTENPHDTWDVACDLYKRLYPEHDEDEVEETRSRGHSKEPAPANGEGEGESSGTGKMEAAPGEEGEGKDESEEGTTISWTMVTLSEHDNGDGGGTVGIDWTDYNRSSELGTRFLDPSDINVVDLAKKSTHHNHSGYLPKGVTNRVLANKVRTYIQAKKRAAIDPEKYTGLLNKQTVSRLALPPIDNGEYNKKIFYDKRERKQLDTCVLLLTDWSGSMQGHKMQCAAQSSISLVNIFDKVLRVPVQLASFSDRQSVCDVGMVKKFSERTVTDDEMARRFQAFYRYSSGNDDADALLWAYREISKRREQRKIIIVLSDGCPAGGVDYYDSDECLRKVTSSIQDEGKVDLLGLGIESDSVQNYYKNYEVIEEVGQLNEALFNLVKRGMKL